MIDRWRKLDRAVRFALTAWLLARLALFAWSLAILALFPQVVQNLVLFDSPVLASFEPGTSARHVFSRMLDGRVLTFKSGPIGLAVDEQTGSLWSLTEGTSTQGELAGQSLQAAPFSAEDIFPYQGVPVDPVQAVAVWQRFDTNWYLEIAEHGYRQADRSTVYLPLYPALIKVVSNLTVSPTLAGLLVSNVALVAALALIYKEAQNMFGEEAARRTGVYLLLFPTAFFLQAVYTESLFLALSIAALYLARRQRWAGAAVVGALAAMTRLQGLLLVLPLVYLWWTSKKAGPADIHRSLPAAASFLLIPAVTGAFLSVTNLQLLTTYQGELHARFVWPWENVWAAVSLLLGGNASAIDILNLLTTLSLGILLAVSWKKLPLDYNLYGVGMYLAPLLRMTISQPLVSMDRYALAIFPAFLMLGRGGKSGWVNRLVVYLGLPLQMYLAAQFLLWGWVG